ncbi:hypothetical protein DFA_06248 [Cavenderia fasciculata]|uniref:Major facilitator superfamily (MFS) profile domain-containing protein n=1 Tax=Cavenderia fasciculata TaxID=261658 RepID=F4PKI5_CACFS|nr:uncharacterized protein DFA_06248 [Cavenderia fasciculata]EGG24109.1 hypothetical protein DFA_06248 [Cavenderia fasciculata]|eukprot:XP_004361960.1 hypothetical protein DFA_06248 [Cavenderia fasciculata]
MFKCIDRSSSSKSTYGESMYYGKSRYLLLLIALVQHVLMSGIIFGWPPLEDQLKRQGTCSQQTLRLNLVYTLGAFTVFGSSLWSGDSFDRHGPVWTSLAAMVFMIAGCLCWYASHMVDDNLYIVAFALLGVGAPSSQISLIHISNLFPVHASTVISSFSGLFVASSFVFKVFSVIANRYNIPLANIFLCYIIVILIAFIPGLYMMHHKPYLPYNEFKSNYQSNQKHLKQLKELTKEKESLISTNETTEIEAEIEKNIKQEEEELIDILFDQKDHMVEIELEFISSTETTPKSAAADSPVSCRQSPTLMVMEKRVDVYSCESKDFKKKPLIKQLQSWQFIGLCLFLSINSLHSIFFIGIINNLFQNDPFYIHAFNYIWDCGFIFVPIVAFIMLKSSITANAFYINLCGILFGVLSSISYPPELQFLGFIITSFQNVYMWGYFYFYLTQTFGFNNYGKLVAIFSLVAAFIGLLEVVYLTLNGMSYFWINFILTEVKLLLFIFPYKLWKYDRTKNIQYKLVQEEEEGLI